MGESGDADQLWHPIETAPKDGVVVLLTRLGSPVVCTGHYRQRVPFPGERDWVGCVIKDPTHWMPLPPLPGGCR